MGFLRGGSVFILGGLLFISLLALNSFFILGSSLKYDHVKEGLYPLLTNLGGSEEIIPKELIGNFNLTKAAGDASKIMKNYCKNNTNYVFSYEGFVVDIPCEELYINNFVEVINKTFDDVVYDIYYKEYDCGFWNCFSKTKLPFFLVSEKARDYWMNKFYISLIVSVILIILILLFIEQKQNILIIVGILLILSTLPLLKFGDLLFALAGKFSVLVNLFISTTHGVFMFSLILGIILIVAGIVLKLLYKESIKQKFSKKEIKEIVKEEIISEKQKQKNISKKKKR